MIIIHLIGLLAMEWNFFLHPSTISIGFVYNLLLSQCSFEFFEQEFYL